MNLSISKAVHDGDVVTLREYKIIRCSQPERMRGAYQSGYEQTLLTLDGKRTQITIPSGIVTWGPILLRSAQPRGNPAKGFRVKKKLESV